MNDVQAGAQGSPSIATLSGGGHVVAWTTPSSSSTAYADVCFQRYDTTAMRAGSNFCIDAHASNATNVIPMADGGFIVVWANGSTGPGPGDGSQAFDANGTPTGGIYPNSQRPGGAMFIVALVGGGWVQLVYHVPVNGGSGIDFMRYGPDATVVQSPTSVGDAGGISARLVALAGGGFAFAWVQNGPTGVVVMSRAFAADGTPLGDPVQMGPLPASIACSKYSSTPCPGWQNLVGITAMPDGGFIVGWIDGTGDAVVLGTYARRFDATGAATGATGQLDTGGMIPGGLAAAGADAFLVTWVDDDSSGPGIALRQFDAAALR